MKVVSVDDERVLLDDLVEILEQMPEISDVKGFTDADEAYKYILSNQVDVAFLDIHMRGIDGLELAQMIKDIKPNVNIIFLTAYSEYTMEAMQMHASGYLLKPVSENDIREELENLRIPISTTPAQKRLKAQCFGNFEIYIDNVPCTFKYVKTKELLAYLIDRRGTYVTNGEILGTLWEDKEVTVSLENYLRNLIGDLRAVFNAANLGDAILKKKGMVAIMQDMFECDYYKLLEGDPGAIGAFAGEYMSQYSWSEYTLAGIESRLDEI